jgi:hypothetical protein
VPTSFQSLIRKPSSKLAALAAGSLAVYWVAFVRPYGLIEWWRQPGMTIGKMTGEDPAAGAMYVAAMLLLFLFYWLACRLVRRRNDRRLWGIVLGGALAMNVLMLALYPVEAADVFDYVIRGRMQALYGQNPFYDRPSSSPVVQDDPFYNYVGWRDYPSAYGPWTELVDTGLARIAGNDVVENVLVFKLASLLALVATTGLIAAILRQTAPERTLLGVTFVTWNPVVIYAVSGNAHNDMLMLFLLVLGLFMFVRKHYTWAAWALTGGALVKFIPGMILPLVVVAALRHQQTWGRRIRYLLVTGAGCAAMVLVSYGHYWRGPEMITDDWRLHLFTTSLPSLLRVTLMESASTGTADLIASRVAFGALALMIAWQSLLLWRDRHVDPRDEWQRTTLACLSVLLFYLLAACTWFEPWYTVWPIVLAALVPGGMARRLAVVTALASVFKMPILDFVMAVRPGHVPPTFDLEWRITLATLALPWAYFAWHWFRRRPAPAGRDQRGEAFG